MKYFINLNEKEISFLNILNPLFDNLQTLNLLKERLYSIKSIKTNSDIENKEEEINKILSLLSSDLILNLTFSNDFINKEELNQDLKGEFGLKSDLKLAFSFLEESSINKFLEIIEIEITNFEKEFNYFSKIRGVNEKIEKIKNNNIYLIISSLIILILFILIYYIQFVSTELKFENLERKSTQISKSLEFISKDLKESKLKVKDLEQRNFKLEEELLNFKDINRKQRLNELKFNINEWILDVKDIEKLKKELDWKEF